MSAGTSEFFCLICLLVCSCTAVRLPISGFDNPYFNNDINIIPVIAERGQDVILPCKVPKKNTFFYLTPVKWSRSRLDPDYYGLLYRNGHLNPDNQHPSDETRVHLQDKEMKDGDVSLNLKKVTMEDKGRYECWVYHRATNDRNTYSREIETTIYLEVVEPGEKDGGDKDGEDMGVEDMDGEDKDGRDKDGRDKNGREMDGGDIDGEDKDVEDEFKNIIRSVLAVILVALASVGFLICRSLDDP